MREVVDAASRTGTDEGAEHRLLMPDGSIKRVRFLSHAINRRPGELSFVGAVMDITAMKNAFEEIQALRDQLYNENLALREEIDVARMFEEIVGSPALQAVLSRVAKVAPTDSTVLITGETEQAGNLLPEASTSARSDPRSMR